MLSQKEIILSQQSAENIRTTLTRINSNTVEIHTVGEVVSQSYVLQSKDLSEGFRDNCILVQQVNDGLHIQVFYPKDVMDLKKEIEQLKKGLQLARNSVSEKDKENGTNVIETSEVEFYDVETQTKSFKDLCQLKDLSSISFQLSGSNIDKSIFQQLQSKFLLREQELKVTIEKLNQQIKLLTKNEKNSQIKNLIKQLEESKSLVIKLQDINLKLKADVQLKNVELNKSLNQISSIKFINSQNDKEKQKLRKEKRSVVLENEELNENNNKLLEDVINLEAKLLTLSEQFSKTEKNEIVVIQKITEQKWQESQELLHKQNTQLKLDINSHLSRNKTLVKEIEVLHQQHKQLNVIVSELRKKNKALKNERKTERAEKAKKQHEQSSEDIVVVSQIVVYDVEIQTELLSQEIDQVFKLSQESGRGRVVSQNNGKVVTVIQTQHHADLVLIKELRQKEIEMEKDIKKRDRQILQLKKTSEQFSSKIKNQKKIIEIIRKEKKDLYRQLHKAEEQTIIEITSEVEIVEYDVEIQTEITALNFQSALIVVYKDPKSIGSPIKGEKQSLNRSRHQSSEIKNVIPEQILCQKQLRKTINKLKDELNRNYSKNKALFKQIEILETRIKQYKKTITTLKNQNKSLKSMKQIVITQTHQKITSQDQVLVTYLVEYDVEVQTQITSLRPTSNSAFTYLDSHTNSSYTTTNVTDITINPTVENVKYIEVPVIVKQQIIKEIQVPGPERIVQVEKIVEKFVDKIVEKPVEVIIEKITQKIIEKPVETIKEVIIQKPIEVIKQVVKEVVKEVIKEKIVEKPVEVIKYVEKVVEKIKQKPVYVDKIVEKEVIKYVNQGGAEVIPSQSTKQYQQLLNFKVQYVKLKDTFDKVYADNLVLIELHNESKGDYAIIQQNKKTISKYEQTIKTLENNIKVFETTIKTHETKIKTYQTNIKTFEVNIRNYEVNNKTLEAQVRKLETTVKTLENTNKTLQTNYKSLETSFKNLESSNRTLENSIKVLKVENTNFTQTSASSVKNYDSMVSKYTLELESTKKINTQSQLLIKRITDQKQSLQIKYQSEIKALKELNQLIKGDVLGIQYQLKRVLKQNSEYVTKIQTFDKQFKQTQIRQQTVSNQNDSANKSNIIKIQSLQKQLRQIKTKEQTLLTQIETIQRTNTTKIQSLQRQILEVKTREQNILSQNNNLQRQNATIQIQIQRLTASESKINSSYLTSVEEIKLLRTYIDGLNKTNEQNSKLVSIQESIQITNLKSDISIKQRTILDYQNNNNKLIAELRILKQEFDNYKRQQNTQAQLKISEETNSTYKIQHQLNIMIESLNIEITNKNTQIEQLKNKLAVQQKNISSLNQQIKSFDEGSGKVTRQVFTQSQTIEQYKLDIYQKDLEFNKLKAEFMKANQLIVKLNGEKDRLSNDVFAFKKEQQEMKLELYDLNLLRIELQQVSANRTEKEGVANDEKYNKLSQEYRKASERIYQLTMELDQERITNSRLRSDYQIATIEIDRLGSDSRVKTLITGNGLVSNEEYLKVLTDLKNAEEVIVSLKSIISEYQKMIDEQDENKDDELDRSAGSQKMYETILKQKIQEYENLIKSKIDYIDDLALKSQQKGLAPDANVIIDKLMRKLRREKAKRQSLEDRLLKLGESLADYEKQIIEKTEKISYLNYLLLNLQQKSELNQTIEDQSLSEIQREERSDDNSMRDYYKDYKPQFGQDYRYKKYLTKGKYSNKNPIRADDRFVIRNNKHVLADDFEVQYQRKRYQDNHQEYYDKINTDVDKQQGNQECISLRTLINDPEDFNILALTAIFLKVIQEVQQNGDKPLHLTPDNIYIAEFDGDNPENIKICFGDSSSRRGSNNSLYESPELILESDYSSSSLIWTLGVIFDELIHKSLFFPKMSAIADANFNYRFRFNRAELQGLKKILLKMVLKDKLQRINLPNLSVGFKLEFEKVYNKDE